jgi:cystathionine beta-lyase
MRHDFDTVINRRGTNSLKYDFAPERNKPDGLLPMWVADMDFSAPPEVLADLQKTVAHGVFGYTEAKQDYYDALSMWFSTRFAFEFGKQDCIKTPGVVFALALAVKAFTEPGDCVLIQTPVYYPFYAVVRDNGRRIVTNPLLYTDGAYSIDFGGFEKKIVENGVKLFLLCSPHNPVGRVWTKGELINMYDICNRHGVLVVSDEIHCDFVWDGYAHTCFGNVSENCIVATAPSKKFNLAGLQVANIIVKNSELRRKIKSELDKTGYSQLNTLGLAACRSAYTHGWEWLLALNVYLQANIAAADSFLKENLPKIRLVAPQGTYLLWLDFSAYGLSQAELDERIISGANLWLDSGTMFGTDGEGFQRVNIACPRILLTEALQRLSSVF